MSAATPEEAGPPDPERGPDTGLDADIGLDRNPGPDRNPGLDRNTGLDRAAGTDPDRDPAPDPASHSGAPPARPRPRTARSRPSREPFDVVVERHGPGVLRLCVARMGPDRGEECFQETLISALRGYDDLRDPEAVGGWLFAIARRKIVDAARGRARTPDPAGDAMEEHLAPWHDPEPGAGGVWAQVAGLPPKQREAIALRYLADLPHADVAVAMGTSVEAARRNVFEGLRRLRDEVER